MRDDMKSCIDVGEGFVELNRDEDTLQVGDWWFSRFNLDWHELREGHTLEFLGDNRYRRKIKEEWVQIDVVEHFKKGDVARGNGLEFVFNGGCFHPLYTRYDLATLGFTFWRKRRPIDPSTDKPEDVVWGSCWHENGTTSTVVRKVSDEDRIDSVEIIEFYFESEMGLI